MSCKMLLPIIKILNYVLADGVATVADDIAIKILLGVVTKKVVDGMAATAGVIAILGYGCYCDIKWQLL